MNKSVRFSRPSRSPASTVQGKGLPDQPVRGFVREVLGRQNVDDILIPLKAAAEQAQHRVVMSALEERTEQLSYIYIY